MARPLSGTSVLDLTRLQPGAYCTRLLADLGADVVKVEPPGGDATRLWPGSEPSPSEVALHRGKRSVTLDLKHPRAAEVLRRLTKQADVLIESARPGSMAEAGMGYEQLSASNPGLVWCSITGFGQTGPYRDIPGHDITYLAFAGVLASLTDISAEPGQPQLLLGPPLGGLMAALGIVAALAERQQTGRGCEVDASIGRSLLWLMNEEVTRAGRSIPPWDLDTPARRVYRCGDGRYVSVAAAEPRTWAALIGGLGLDDLAGPPGGPKEQAGATAKRIASAFESAPATHWVATLGHAGVGPVNDAASVADDPHVRATDAVQAAGQDRVVAGPLRFGGKAAVPAGPPAPLGADTGAVLAGNGFTDEEIADLRAAGVFGRQP